VFQATWDGKQDKPFVVTIQDDEFESYSKHSSADKIAEMYFDRVI
jgi:hypothetical protein